MYQGKRLANILYGINQFRLLSLEVSLLNSFGRQILNTNSMIPLSLEGSSKGNQRKWLTRDDCYVKEQFFYQNKYWRDDLVEIIASELCLQLGFDVVVQNGVEIKDSITGNEAGSYLLNRCKNLGIELRGVESCVK